MIKTKKTNSFAEIDLKKDGRDCKGPDIQDVAQLQRAPGDDQPPHQDQGGHTVGARGGAEAALDWTGQDRLITGLPGLG